MLFNTIDKMFHRTTEKLYSTCGSQTNLAGDFADFFIGKITKIRAELTADTVPHPNLHNHREIQ